MAKNEQEQTIDEKSPFHVKYIYADRPKKYSKGVFYRNRIKVKETGVSREDGYSQMLIETQNINVTACKFYKKQGAVLSKVDMYAYYSQPDSRDEIQFIMYLDL